MKMSTPARVSGGILLLIILFWGWYSVAASYDYDAVSGTYSLQLSNGESSTLVLNKDRSFEQELNRERRVEHVQGSWRRIGEGGVVFSQDFLKLTGQEVRPDGQADGEIKKSFGLFLSIALNPDPGGPVFRKKLF